MELVFTLRLPFNKSWKMTIACLLAEFWDHSSFERVPWWVLPNVNTWLDHRVTCTDCWILGSESTVCDLYLYGGRPAGALAGWESKFVLMSLGWNLELAAAPRLTWSKLSVFHSRFIWHFLTVNILIISSGTMALLQPLLYSLQLSLLTGHVEMVENENFLHSNSAKIVPDWSILRSVSRINESLIRADVPLIPEWIVERYFHS